MAHFLQFPVIVLLFVCVRAGDIAISAGVKRDILRAVIYGILALFALVALVLAVVVR
jgi:hypothetical protein